MWALILGFFKPVYDFIKMVLDFLMRIIIPIPLLLIIILGIWWHYDKDSYAKQKVQEALVTIVSNATIDAMKLDAQINDIIIDRQETIINEAKARILELEGLNEEFEAERKTVSALTTRLTKELENVRKVKPSTTTNSTDKVCDDTVDAEFLNSLRNFKQ